MSRSSSRSAPAALLLGVILASSCGAQPHARDVLLISVDTLRADHLGFSGWPSADTPRLDALAAGAVVYEQAVAAAPLTLPAHATMLSGMLPLEHGARDNRPFRFPAERLDTIATTLAGRGYHTIGVIGGEPLRAGCGLERDFEIYDDALPPERPGTVRLPERDAEAVTDAALSRLAALDDDRPFFAFVHYFDPHDPYVPPEPYATRFAAAPYDGEIAYVDAQIGRLLDGLAARGRLDDAIVVVTADHGESLGEHGEARHGYYVYDATIHVPLVVRIPGAPPRRCADQVRIQDLRAFLEDAAAGGNPILEAPALRGESAFSESAYGAIHCGWAELRALRHPRGSKYIEGGVEEFYDLRADPRELHDLAARDVGPDGRPLGASTSPRTSLEDARRALDATLRRLAPSTPVPGRPDRSDAAGSSSDPARLQPGTPLPGYLGTPAALGRAPSREANARRPAPRALADVIAALTEGVRLLEMNQAVAACDLMESARARDPENPALLFQLARAQRRAALQERAPDRIDRAIDALQAVRRLRPDNLPARDLLVFTLAQRGRFEDAIALGEEAERDDTATAATCEAMARIYLDLPEDRARAFTDRTHPLADDARAFTYLEKHVARAGRAANRALLEALRRRYIDQGAAVQAGRVQELLDRVEAAAGADRAPAEGPGCASEGPSGASEGEKDH